MNILILHNRAKKIQYNKKQGLVRVSTPSPESDRSSLTASSPRRPPSQLPPSHTLRTATARAEFRLRCQVALRAPRGPRVGPCPRTAYCHFWHISGSNRHRCRARSTGRKRNPCLGCRLLPRTPHRDPKNTSLPRGMQLTYEFTPLRRTCQA